MGFLLVTILVTVILQVDVVRTRMMVQRRLQGGQEEGVRLYKSTIHCAYHTVSEFVLKREFKFFLTLQVQLKGGRLAWSASLQICRWCPRLWTEHDIAHIPRGSFTNTDNQTIWFMCFTQIQMGTRTNFVHVIATFDLLSV